MSKLDAIEADFQKRMANYQYRADTFLCQMPPFDRLCWFIAAAGEYRKKYTTNEEWLSVVKGAGLVEIMEHINSIGTPVEKPPPKKTLSDDELLED